MTTELTTPARGELSAAPGNPMSLLVGADLSAIDTDKIGKLMEMQAAWEARDAKRQFNEALAAFQAEMPPVFKGRKESKGKYTYAAYEDIMRIARPILRTHGLAPTFSQEETEFTLTVKCKISHVGGHSEETPFTLPKDGPIKTQDGRNVTSQAQAQGSANSYARRYALCNALDIVVTGEDDDAAGTIRKLNEEQAREVEGRLVECEKLDKGMTGRFLEWLGVEHVNEIPVESYHLALNELNRKIKAAKK
jgi:hypothetical protein